MNESIGVFANKLDSSLIHKIRTYIAKYLFHILFSILCEIYAHVYNSVVKVALYYIRRGLQVVLY